MQAGANAGRSWRMAAPSTYGESVSASPQQDGFPRPVSFSTARARSNQHRQRLIASGAAPLSLHARASTSSAGGSTCRRWLGCVPLNTSLLTAPIAAAYLAHDRPCSCQSATSLRKALLLLWRAPGGCDTA